jgi:hypothetical protein
VNTEQEEENFGSACDEWDFLSREGSLKLKFDCLTQRHRIYRTINICSTSWNIPAVTQ